MRLEPNPSLEHFGIADACPGADDCGLSEFDLAAPAAAAGGIQRGDPVGGRILKVAANAMARTAVPVRAISAELDNEASARRNITHIAIAMMGVV